MTTITCTDCERQIQFDVIADGLPEHWAQLPIARGEATAYTGPDGAQYTADDIGGDVRPHAILCPQCHTKFFPWV